MKKKILLFLFLVVVSIFSITNIYASEDKYDGDYTIEYLLRNYNVVTFGTKNRYQYTSIDADLTEEKGSVIDVFDIGGPVLIRGNYIGNTGLEYPNEFAQKTNKIPSYIKGNVGTNIVPGSPEGTDESNIYVSSLNSIEGNRINNNDNTYEYTIKQSDNYVDFDKLYESIVKEQSKINRGTKLEINNTFNVNFDWGGPKISFIVINSPGYYTIDDISSIREIRIDNYDEDGLYFITINSDIVYEFPIINIYPSGSYSRIKTLYDSIYSGFNEDDTFTKGNVIFNFPNAKYIYENYTTIGHIIAPKADVELTESHYPGTIIANSITAPKDKYTAIQFFPFTLNENFLLVEDSPKIEEYNDIDNDLYYGDYSIIELLKNYSVVTLGQKSYNDKSQLKNLTDENGSVSIFHIGGQFLINGNLGVDSVTYSMQNPQDYKGIRLDFRENEKGYHSYIKGKLNSMAYDINYTKYQYMNYGYKYAGLNRIRSTIEPILYVGSSNKITYWKESADNHRDFYYRNEDYDLQRGPDTGPEVRYNNYDLDTVHTTVKTDNYINFTRLYNSIINQQKQIDEGELKKSDENKNVHLEIGGNYTIENVSDLENIIFTNYDENKDKLTIVTIRDSGDISLPTVGKGTEDSISATKVYTNDYINGDTYINSTTRGVKVKNNDEYYGNIIWNIPNATHIELAEKAPFIGHVIAPNADVETPELHFAGAMIVNSLYTKGRSEAHFYPLSVDDGLFRQLERIDISGTKTWDDKDNQDGRRPESININLLADGEKIDSVSITEEDNWKYEFKNLVKSNGNDEINYTITEDSVDHYSTEIDGYDVINSYTPEKTSLTVNKVWKDEDNKDKIRPESIEVELYANGKKVDTTELSEENDWTYIFTEIDMNSNGKRIEYTVKEKELEGYTTEITGNQETGYTIINTHEIKVEEKENPVTYDNIVKFAIISVISTLMLAIGIIVYHKNRKEA